MKKKEEMLHINVKNMALQKKKLKRKRKNISGTLDEITPLDLRRPCLDSTHHIDMKQRMAWEKDLLDITTRGRIEQASSQYWSFNKNSHEIEKGKFSEYLVG